MLAVTGRESLRECCEGAGARRWNTGGITAYECSQQACKKVST